MKDTIKRNITIDLIKAVSIFGVIVIHVVSSILTQGEIGSFQWMCALFWGSLVRGSVPLFLLASGAIMLDARKRISLKKLYFHNIARIVVAMLVWGFGYKLYRLLIDGQLNLTNILYSFKRLLLFDQEFHLYYIHIILLVYAFLPMTRVFAEKADKRTFEYAIGIWAFFSIVWPTLRKFEPFSLITGIPIQWTINLAYSAIGYGVLGYYLNTYPLKFRKSILCFSIGFIITFGMTFYLSAKYGTFNDMFLQGTSPGVFLLVTGIFSFARFIKVEKYFAKLIVFVSRASFCIYLSHIFILYILIHFGVMTQMLPTIISIPLISGSILLICLIIYFVISKIPILNKWII